MDNRGLDPLRVSVCLSFCLSGSLSSTPPNRYIYSFIYVHTSPTTNNRPSADPYYPDHDEEEEHDTESPPGMVRAHKEANKLAQDLARGVGYGDDDDDDDESGGEGDGQDGGGAGGGLRPPHYHHPQPQRRR